MVFRGLRSLGCYRVGDRAPAPPAPSPAGQDESCILSR